MGWFGPSGIFGMLFLFLLRRFDMWSPRSSVYYIQYSQTNGKGANHMQDDIYGWRWDDARGTDPEVPEGCPAGGCREVVR